MSNCFAFLWTCFRKWRNHSDGHYSGCPKYVTFSGRALHVTKEEVKSRNKYISWMIIDCVEHLKKWNAVWQLVSVTSSLWPMEMLLNYTNIFNVSCGCVLISRKENKLPACYVNTGPRFIPQQFADVLTWTSLQLTKHTSFVCIKMFYNHSLVWFGLVWWFCLNIVYYCFMVIG